MTDVTEAQWDAMVEHYQARRAYQSAQKTLAKAQEWSKRALPNRGMPSEYGPVMVYGSNPELAAPIPDLKPTKHPHLFVVLNHESDA